MSSGPDKSVSRTEIARTHLERGEYETALRVLSELIEGPNPDKHALGTRAWVYRETQHYQEAFDDYKRLVQTDPSDLEARILLADTAFLIKNYEFSLECAINVLKIDKLNVPALKIIQKCHKEIELSKKLHLPKKDRLVPLIDVSEPFYNYLEIENIDTQASINRSIAQLLYYFTRNIRPGLVVETGTNLAYSTFWIAKALKEQGFGHIHSFDLFDGGEKASQTNKIDYHYRLVNSYKKQAGMGDYVTFHKGDSAAGIGELFASRPGLKIDFAFIDGDHSINGCYADWKQVDRYLADSGYVILHDANISSGWIGPKWLTDKLAENEQKDYSLISLNCIDSTGLTILQKNRSVAYPPWKPSLKELVAQFLTHKIFGWKR